jgi:4-coumarate--CoA ligase (photoactive yellow protein activation family)
MLHGIFFVTNFMINPSPKLHRTHIQRILASLITSELQRIRKGTWSGLESVARAETPIAVWRGSDVTTPDSATPDSATPDSATSKNAGFEADSLELLTLAARVNQFFRLHETGIEDYLLRRPTLGEWAELVEQALELGTSGIAFQTSGSTGEPKLCFQSWRAIWREVEVLADVLSLAQHIPVQRIIACVQPHHIYGFLFTAALPSLLGCDVVEGLHTSPAALLHSLRDNDSGNCIVSFPTYWEYLAESLPQFPSGVQGVTSTASCPTPLKQRLRAQGIERLVEVYGSSETSGVGWRENEEEYFRLFPYWQLRQDPEGRFRLRVRDVRDEDANEEYELMDTLELMPDGRFKPTGRVDGGVQVGGVNVFPTHIAERMKTLECVADCAVRLMRSDEGNRLKAFVVLQAGWEATSETEQYIRRWMQENLSAPERPVSLTFGAVLPKNAMGKVVDWQQ